jgi:hypothetical protein
MEGGEPGMEGPEHMVTHPSAFSTKPEVPQYGILGIPAASIIIGAGMIRNAIGSRRSSSEEKHGGHPSRSLGLDPNESSPDAVFLHLVVEGVAADVQRLGGFADVAAEVEQSVLDGLLFHLVQRDDGAVGEDRFGGRFLFQI